jgi:DNA replication protein DnaC
MNGPKTTVLLEHHLKALKLPTVLREYVPVAAACGQEKADYATYLLRLTERELLDRERRAVDRRLQAAQLPVVKTFDTFDSLASPRSTRPWSASSCAASTSPTVRTS